MSQPPHAPLPGQVPTPPELARRLLERLPAPPTPVLDPACGAGALLLAALERAGCDPEYAAQGLYGIELDPLLAARARERLLAAVPRAARGASLRRALEEHVRCADALDPSIQWPSGAAIAANPPWVSLSGRHAVQLPAAQAQHVRELCREAGGGWPSTQAAFLLRIARQLAVGERAALLLPWSLCHQERSRAVRDAVQGLCSLPSTPEPLGERAFEHVLEPAVLLELERREPGAEDRTSRWSQRAPLPDALHRLEHLPRLPAASFGDPGVHTGNCSRELVFEEPGPGRVAVREGRDLSEYELTSPRRFLRLDLPADAEHRFRIPVAGRLEHVPVLLRQTADRPRAALHRPAARFRNSLLACSPPPELAPAFVVGVLNSCAVALWHRIHTADARQKSFPQLKVAHLRALPFPIAGRDRAPELHDRVANLVEERGVTAQHEIEELVLEMYGLSPDERAQVRDSLAQTAPTAKRR